MKGRGRICFFAPFLYPVMSRGAIPFAGGAEVQQAAMARGLVTQGFEVTIVTCDYGQPERLTVDGIELLRAYRPDAGVRFLRFVHPRFTLSARALVASRAQVHFVQAAGIWAGIPYEVARLTGRRFVMMTAHDFDTIRPLPLLTTVRERWWQRRALRGADQVLSQTEVQRVNLLREFGVASQVVANPMDVPEAPADPGRDGVVLWIATYKPPKRPEWFTALARALPQHRFLMCGVVPEASTDQGSWQAAREAARALPNLEVRGFVEREKLGDVLRQAALFVHTSPAEGFPNAVLEAWAHGLPSVSAVDPDGVVRREELGEVVEDLDALVESTRRWMSDPARRVAAGGRARAYVRSKHDPRAVSDRLAAVFDRLLERPTARAGS
jgi:glycosyltransferase involved in cell wall biosynthesis